MVSTQDKASVQALKAALLISLCIHACILLWVRQVAPNMDSTRRYLTVLLQPAAINADADAADRVALPKEARAPDKHEPSLEPRPEPGHVPELKGDTARSPMGMDGSAGRVEPPHILPQPSTEFYYPVSEVDQIPSTLIGLPGNPEELRSFSDGGEIHLELFIDEFGKVRKVRSWPTALPDSFKQFVVTGFLKSSFMPARKDGLAVKSRMHVLVEFAALGLDGTPRIKTSLTHSSNEDKTTRRPSITD